METDLYWSERPLMVSGVLRGTNTRRGFVQIFSLYDKKIELNGYFSSHHVKVFNLEVTS